MAFELTHTNVTSVKKNVSPSNLRYGFTLWTNGSTFIRTPYDVLGTPLVTAVTGYTKVSENPSSTLYHNGAESNIDFTNGGTNTSIPSTYNNVTFDSSLLNPYFYRKSKSGANTLRNDRYLIYSVVQDETTKIERYTREVEL
jgi:hypothetical protein